MPKWNVHKDVVYAFVKSELDRACADYAEATEKFSTALTEVAYMCLWHYKLSVEEVKEILNKYENSNEFETELKVFMEHLFRNCYQKRDKEKKYLRCAYSKISCEECFKRKECRIMNERGF